MYGRMKRNGYSGVCYLLWRREECFPWRHQLSLGVETNCNGNVQNKRDKKSARIEWLTGQRNYFNNMTQ